MEQKHRILIADDDDDIRELLKLYLDNSGYEVIEARNGEEAIACLDSGQIDLVLLDIMMPVMDGYQALKLFRERSPIPIIIISAKGQDQEKILGLNLGADDYLVKPFNPLEAVARVNSLLRRVKCFDANSSVQSGSERASAKTDGNSVLKVRDLALDLDSCTLTQGGNIVELTYAEFRIMEMLMRNPGRVFTKQQIYECGWQEEYVASENNVMVCISKLRAKLSDDSGCYIKTIRGIGYRLEK